MADETFRREIGSVNKPLRRPGATPAHSVVRTPRRPWRRLGAFLLVAGLGVAATPAPALAQVFERGPTAAEVDRLFRTERLPGEARSRGLGRAVVFDRDATAKRPVRVTPKPERVASTLALPALTGRALNIRIQFAFDSDRLLLSEGGKLEGLVEWLRQNADRDLLIAGHTDAVGAASYNFGLSGRRALSVRDFLVEHRGFRRERFVVAGYGETVPLPEVRPTAGLNRRVEFRLIE